MDQHELALSPRKADVEQAPFLVNIHFLSRPHVGQKPLFTAGDKDHGEFQALGRVQGHQSYPIGTRVIGVGLTLQCSRFQKGGQVVAKGYGAQHELVH